MVKKKSVLIIGSMGRDHSIGWKLCQSPKVGSIYFAPGSPGTEKIGTNTGIDQFDFDGLVAFAKSAHIDLSFCSSDDALAQGVVDAFADSGLLIFGPTKKAAQIESSKVFAKQLMQTQGIPTAAYRKFTDAKEALAYSKTAAYPQVIKASGLALGKGVCIVRSWQEAKAAIEEIMVKKIFGTAGEQIIVEEYLTGREISVHAFADGKSVSFFPLSRDHKPIFEGNHGPNTGGMGTIAPVGGLDKAVVDLVVRKALEGMKKQGIPFIGCLYPGVILDPTGPKVLEYNCRFGDPETESYMRLLKSDLFDIFWACATGSLSTVRVVWDKKFACCIVLASGGYPGPYIKGQTIYGVDEAEIANPDIVVFHMGTKRENGRLVTNGGRVLGVTATGKTLESALKKAYSVIGVQGIHFKGMQYRADIGKI